MPSIFAQTRILLNTSTASGQVATVPASNDHTDGTWLPTDVYPGELLLNYTDGTISFRTVNGIKTIQVVQKSDQQLYSISVTIPSGSIATLNTTPYQIIPAPASGCIEIVSASVKLVPGSTPYAAVGTLYIVVGSNTNNSYAQVQLSALLLAQTFSGGNLYQKMSPFSTSGLNNNILPNQGTYFLSSAPQTGGGNGTLTVNVLYRIINV